MTEFKEQWNLEAALKVVQHPTVDSKLWAEAVEWLIIYGPPEVVQLLLQASHDATAAEFPELQANYTRDGQPCYDLAAIAESLGISEEEAREIIAKKEAVHKRRHLVGDDDIAGIQ